jgi:hypothetical protein
MTESLKALALIRMERAEAQSRVSQANEIIARGERDALKSQLDDYTLMMTAKYDALAAKLAEMEVQEHVGTIDHGMSPGCINWSENPYEIEDGAKLFLAPGTNPDAKDAERYRTLRDYLISPMTIWDDAIVDAKTAPELDAAVDAIDAAIEGAKK